MTTKRHNSRDDNAVLDAARDCVLAVGVRRTTLTDVARRAGVSRMTLYRRWPDVRTLVGDLMTREWIAVALGAAPERDEATPTRERLVEGVVAAVRAVSEHPLFRKIVDVDPELLLPYVLDRRGASQDALLAFLVETLEEGHADGSVRVDHTVRQARSLLLVAQSFTLSLRTMCDEGGAEAGGLAARASAHAAASRSASASAPAPASTDADPELAAAAFHDELRHILERTLAP